MSYSHEELKILMAENALDNAKVHTARMKRRAHHAESEYATAMVEEERFKEAVEALRANYLKKVPT